MLDRPLKGFVYTELAVGVVSTLAAVLEVIDDGVDFLEA